jgi:hypothetical protein
MSWVESCPLEGRCTECGLEIEYRFVLNPALWARWRFFESALSRPVRAWWETMWRAGWPRRFWVWVRMFHRVSYARMIGGAVAAMVCWYATIAAFWVTLIVLPGAMTAAFLGTRATSRVFEMWVAALADVCLVPSWSVYDAYSDDGRGSPGPLVLWGAVTVCLVPLAFLALPYTLRRAKVRRVHLVRIAAWGMVTPALVALSAVSLSRAALEWVSFGGGQDIGPPVLDVYFARESEIVFGVVIVWVWWWWATACGLYLKLPRAKTVALAMVVMAVLAALVALMPLPGVREALVMGWWR